MKPQPHPILRPMHPPIRPEQRLWRWFRSLYPLSQAGLGCLVLLFVFFLCSICATPDMRQSFAQGLKPMTDAWNNVHETDALTATASASASSAGTPEWTTTNTFSGSGTGHTATFVVTGAWQLNWYCALSSSSSMSQANMSINIVRAGEQTPVVPFAVDANCSESTYSGATEESQTGALYLVVTSNTQWTVEVEQLQ